MKPTTTSFPWAPGSVAEQKQNAEVMKESAVETLGSCQAVNMETKRTLSVIETRESQSKKKE